MKHALRWLACILFTAAAWPASAAVNCSITQSPTPIKGIYSNFFGNVDLQGTFNVTCTRAGNNDTRRPDLWIGVNQTTAGSTATLDTGGTTVNYTIYHANYGSGIWLNTGAGVAPTSTTNGAVLDTTPDFGPQGMALTETYNFYVRFPWANLLFRPAGVYLSSVAVQLRLTGPTGTLLDTATLDVILSIPKSCRFSTPPTAVTINYPAFSPTAIPGTSNFALTCTQGTGYTLALDQTRSVIPTVNLAYGLSISTNAATGTAVAQSYTVNISVDANQAGRCATSVCTGTDTRTITVSY